MYLPLADEACRPTSARASIRVNGHGATEPQTTCGSSANATLLRRCLFVCSVSRRVCCVLPLCMFSSVCMCMCTESFGHAIDANQQRNVERVEMCTFSPTAVLDVCDL